jgi:hypothetical protein
VDIAELILDDHHRQRLAFARLDEVDRADTEDIGLIWNRLAQFLEVHAAAEEAIFYPELLRQADQSGAETRDAIHDHNEIREAVADVARHPIGSDAWLAAVGKARKANTDHMGEEEDDGLPDFRRHASLELRHQLAVRFEAAKAAPVAATLDYTDKDSARYIAEHAPE